MAEASLLDAVFGTSAWYRPWVTFAKPEMLNLKSSWQASCPPRHLGWHGGQHVWRACLHVWTTLMAPAPVLALSICCSSAAHPLHIRCILAAHSLHTRCAALRALHSTSCRPSPFDASRRPIQSICSRACIQDTIKTHSVALQHIQVPASPRLPLQAHRGSAHRKRQRGDDAG